MNAPIFYTLLNRYEETAFTNQYIIGYNDRGTVYASFCTAEVLPYITTLDRSAMNRKGGYSLRFKPNKMQKEILKMGETFVVCSVAYLEEEFKASKYNRGEIFEKMITEHFNQVWVKDNVPYTKAGDIEVDGIAYQIKYENATFCNESIL